MYAMLSRAKNISKIICQSIVQESAHGHHSTLIILNHITMLSDNSHIFIFMYSKNFNRHYSLPSLRSETGSSTVLAGAPMISK